MIMKYTENYKLKMPEGNDYVSVDDFNENFNAVDKELAQQKSDLTKYLPLAGGMLSDSLFLDKSNGVQGKTELYKNNSSSADYGTCIKDFDASGNSASLDIKAKDNKITFKPVGGSNGVLFGEHNKPRGSYTGNGSATERYIDTGGIGKRCYIYGTNGYACLVDNEGAISHADTNANIVALLRKEIKFVNGVITIATTNDRCNENGKTFYWEVE